MESGHDVWWKEMLDEYRRVIDESADILEDIEYRITGNDTIRPAQLHHLYDMAEEAAEAGRIRRAEENLHWRGVPASDNGL